MSKQSDFSEQGYGTLLWKNFSIKMSSKLLFEKSEKICLGKVFPKLHILNAKSEIDQGRSKWNRFKHQIKAKFYFKCCLCLPSVSVECYISKEYTLHD